MSRPQYMETIEVISGHLKRTFGHYAPEQLCEDLSLTASYSACLTEIVATTESAYRKEQGAVLSELPETMRAYERETTVNQRTADYRYWRDYAQNLAKAAYARMDALRTVIANKREEFKILGAQEH